MLTNLLHPICRAGSIALAALFVSGCREHPKSATNPSSETRPKSRDVRVATVAVQPLDRAVVVQGSLEAKQQVVLSAKVAGRVQTIAVDLGSAVKSGEIVARLEPRD